MCIDSSMVLKEIDWICNWLIGKEIDWKEVKVEVCVMSKNYVSVLSVNGEIIECWKRGTLKPKASVVIAGYCVLCVIDDVVLIYFYGLLW